MSFLVYQQQNPEFLNNYLKYKRCITFKAGTTVDETYFDLRTLLRYIKLLVSDKKKLDYINAEEFKNVTINDVTIQDLDQVKSNDIDNYITFLKYVLNNSPITRNRKLASSKNLFDYLYSNKLIRINPTDAIPSANIGKRVPKYLNINESKKLLATTINSNKLYKIRNYAITCIFLNCSLRLSELTQINLTDFKIDNSEQTLRVHGKGNKERIIYLNEAVCEAINTYLKTRQHLDRSNKDYNALFLSSRNKRISNRAVQTIIEDELKLILEENKKGYHAHTLRHTGATLLYNENNVNVFVLRKILGHTSISSTEIYTHVSDKKLRYIMENCTISSILEREGSKV